MGEPYTKAQISQYLDGFHSESVSEAKNMLRQIIDYMPDDPKHPTEEGYYWFRMNGVNSKLTGRLYFERGAWRIEQSGMGTVYLAKCIKDWGPKFEGWGDE